MGKVLSSHVGMKINEWYRMIRQFSVPDAEILKAEVEAEIERMEEDQHLLIYYQLMCFRHQIMLDYIHPSKYQPFSVSNLVDKIENSNHELSDMLHYYHAFFRGMHEFSQKEYLEAVKYYRMAEKQLSMVFDDIEQAEFHFKVAEAYYIMKQTHVSMHHILKALEIYDQHDAYSIRIIQCLFVISGNYQDLKRKDRALPHLKKAKQLASEIDHPRIYSSALYNLGKCYGELGYREEAEQYLTESADLAKKELLPTLPHTLYTLAKLLFRQNEQTEARRILEDGKLAAKKHEDQLFCHMFEYLDALYVQEINEEQLQKTIDYLEKLSLYSYIEDISLEIATALETSQQYQKSNQYYQKLLWAQNQIQEGECLYEF